jgi:hypothetical protein
VLKIIKRLKILTQKNTGYRWRASYFRVILLVFRAISHQKVRLFLDGKLAEGRAVEAHKVDSGAEFVKMNRLS